MEKSVETSESWYICEGELNGKPVVVKSYGLCLWCWKVLKRSGICFLSNYWNLNILWYMKYQGIHELARPVRELCLHVMVHVAIEVRMRTLYQKLILRIWHLKFPNDFVMIVNEAVHCLLYACKSFY